VWRRILPSSPQYHVAFRVAGLFIWVFLSLPAFDSTTRKGELISPGQWMAWLILFFSFAPAFWISSSTRAFAPWTRVLALAVQTGCVLGMTATYQGYLAPHYHLGWRWSATGALLGFQGFAITAAVAKAKRPHTKSKPASMPIWSRPANCCAWGRI
jgi:hypothetical protein